MVDLLYSHAPVLLLGAMLAGCATSTTLDAEDSGPGTGISDSAPSVTPVAVLPAAPADAGARPCEDISPPLAVFQGFRSSWFQRWDEMFKEEAARFNQGQGYLPGDTGWLDPNVLKSWALQESGSMYGHGADIWRAGDMFQVNDPENWTADKVKVLGLDRGTSLSPRMSARSAIRYAVDKASIYRSTKRIPVLSFSEWEPFTRFHRDADGHVVETEARGFRRFFTGWDNALRLYNGNRAPARNWDATLPPTDADGSVYEMREHYARVILDRAAQAGTR